MSEVDLNADIRTQRIIYMDIAEDIGLTRKNSFFKDIFFLNSKRRISQRTSINITRT